MSEEKNDKYEPLIWLQGHREVGSTFDGHIVLDRDFRDSGDPAVIVSDLYQAAPDLRDALVQVQKALAAHRDGKTYEHPEHGEIETLEEVKYLVVDPVLDEAGIVSDTPEGLT